MNLAIDNGRMKVSNAAQGTYVYIPELATVPGRTYRVDYTVDLNNSGSISAYARDVVSSANLFVQSVSSNGYAWYEFTATGTRTRIAFENTAAATRTFYLDNFFVYEKDGATHYDAVVLMTADYYAFGMQMPGRNSNTDSYRYGFNGMEKDNEVKGDGNSYTTEFRQYDPRLGRWLSLDPLMTQFPWMSPYVAFDNNPVYYTDPSGLAAEDWIKKPGSNKWEWDEGVKTEEQAIGKYGEGTDYKKPNTYSFLSTKTFNGEYLQAYLLNNDIHYKNEEGLWFNMQGMIIDPGYTEQQMEAQRLHEKNVANAEALNKIVMFNAAITGAPLLLQFVPLAGSAIGVEVADLALYTYISAEGALTTAITKMTEYTVGRFVVYGASLYTEYNFFNLRRASNPPPTVAKGGANLWKVGSYNELKGLEAGLQAHHVGQKSLMNRLVSGYNPANAPSILVPKIGHVTNMPGIGRVAATRGLGGFTNARQVLARDIFELRRVYGSQGIPNSSLQQLIQMNKTMYPGTFIK